jgi:hypothetical protein
MSALPTGSAAAPKTSIIKEYPRLVWDIGTAYDFFMSLEVLFHPDQFGSASFLGCRGTLALACRRAEIAGRYPKLLMGANALDLFAACT